jgi:hypothetical protein
VGISSKTKLFARACLAPTLALAMLFLVGTTVSAQTTPTPPTKPMIPSPPTPIPIPPTPPSPHTPPTPPTPPKGQPAVSQLLADNPEAIELSELAQREVGPKPVGPTPKPTPAPTPIPTPPTTPIPNPTPTVPPR